MMNEWTYAPERFDHRVVDGDGMSRFIADVASVLEEPALLLD